MAIGLEFEFRSNPAAGASDGNIRQGAAREQGSEFAAVLSRSKKSESEATRQAESITPAFVSPALQGLLTTPTEGELEGTAETASLQEAEAAFPGELETDREIEERHDFEEVQGLPATPVPSRLSASVEANVAEAGETPEVAFVTGQPTHPVPQAALSAESTQPEVQVPEEAASFDASVATADTPAVTIAEQIVLPDSGATTATDTDTEARPSMGSADQVAAVPAADRAAGTDTGDTSSDDGAARDQAHPEPTILTTAAPAASERTSTADGVAPAASGSQAAAQLGAVAGAPAQVITSATPAPAPLPLAPAHAMVTAAPAEVTDILSKSAEDGQSDRVVIQLDPPELGRVSIDFRFESGGLQHVTITGETPEAMRQLRAMHFELVQALEKQGLDAQSMTFQQQQNPQQQTSAAMLRQLQAGQALRVDVPAAEISAPLPTKPNTANGRLDMRL